jgi:hypothetical protein
VTCPIGRLHAERGLVEMVVLDIKTVEFANGGVGGIDA